MKDYILLEEHVVPENKGGERLQNYCYDLFESLPTHKSVKKTIKKGHLTINGTEAGTGTYVNPGDTIRVYQSKLKGKVYQRSLQVLFEDEYMAIVNKPAGLPTSGNSFHTLENALPYNLRIPDDKILIYRPRPAHRLDSLTGGLIIAAKSLEAERTIRQMFEERLIKKTYHAIVRGVLAGSGTWDSLIDDRDATTQYQHELNWEHKYLGPLTLLKLHPVTGRTHQLRIHCSAAGHPILGDPIYGGEEDRKKKGMYLLASAIELEHPFTDQKISVELPFQGKFKKMLFHKLRIKN